MRNKYEVGRKRNSVQTGIVKYPGLNIIQAIINTAITM